MTGLSYSKQPGSEGLPERVQGVAAQLQFVPERRLGRLWRHHHESIFADRLVLFRHLRQREPLLGHRNRPWNWRSWKLADWAEWHLHQLRLPIQCWSVVVPERVQGLAAQLQDGSAQEPRGLWRILPLDSYADTHSCHDHKSVARHDRFCRLHAPHELWQAPVFVPASDELRTSPVQAYDPGRTYLAEACHVTRLRIPASHEPRQCAHACDH